MSSFRALARLRHASIKGLFSVQPSSTGCTITDVIGYTAAALLLYFAAEERRSIFTNVTKALLQYYRDATHIDDKRGNCNLHGFFYRLAFAPKKLSNSTPKAKLYFDFNRYFGSINSFTYNK